MSIVVLKYGGSSVATPEQIKAIARQVVQTKAAGEDPVVVVSAMGQTTDDLLKLAHALAENPRPRELDMLLSVGERIAIALMALAINALGPYEAVSLTGSQVGIITDTNHTRAKILELRCGRIKQVIEQGKIPIVAGFQGVSIEKEITTLGRGGSDTTAVALAAALGAKQCRILKDVPGVQTADPKVVPEARLIPQLNYEQMLEFSATGSKVLAPDSVSLARRHGVEIAVGDSASGAIGTIITSGEFGGSGVKGVVAYRKLIALRLQRHADLAPALVDLHTARVSIKNLHSEAQKPVLLLDANEARRLGIDSAPASAATESLLLSSDWGRRAQRVGKLHTRISAVGGHLEPEGKHFAWILSCINAERCRPRWFCCSPIRVSFCIVDERAPTLIGRLHQSLIEALGQP